MTTKIKEDHYIKSDVGNNNNKFWIIRLFDDASVETEWGRVGAANPQSKTKSFGSMSGAEAFYSKKCSEKEKSGRNGEIAYRKLDLLN